MEFPIKQNLRHATSKETLESIFNTILEKREQHQVVENNEYFKFIRKLIHYSEQEDHSDPKYACFLEAV